MIPKSVLDAAKAFLCWDIFKDLTIQLVEIQGAVGYYYPPLNESHLITLFYPVGTNDFARPLYLLFHEAGHAQQWLSMPQKDRRNIFCSLINLDKGPEKDGFEGQAWKLGRNLFIDFIKRENLALYLLDGFDGYNATCMKSYKPWWCHMSMDELWSRKSIITNRNNRLRQIYITKIKEIYLNLFQNYVKLKNLINRWFL